MCVRFISFRSSEHSTISVIGEHFSILKLFLALKFPDHFLNKALRYQKQHGEWTHDGNLNVVASDREPESDASFLPQCDLPIHLCKQTVSSQPLR